MAPAFAALPAELRLAIRSATCRKENFALAPRALLPYSDASTTSGRLGVVGLSLIRQVLGDPPMRGRLAIVEKEAA